MKIEHKNMEKKPERHSEYIGPRCKVLGILDDEGLCAVSIDDVGSGGDIDGGNYNSKEMNLGSFAEGGEGEEGSVWY